MNDDTETISVTTCGVSLSANRARVSVYFGSGAGGDKSFEVSMPKDLALHMAETIRKLAEPVAARADRTTRRSGRP